MHSVSYEYIAVVPLASDSTMVNLDHATETEASMHSYCPFIKCTLEVFMLNSWAYCQSCTLCRIVVPPHVVKGGKINWGQLV